MTKQQISEIELPKLPNDFNITKHLEAAEQEAEGIRFVAKVLGEENGQVFCETIDGVYCFNKNDVFEMKSINRQFDLIIIHINAHYTLKSTVSRLLRSKREMNNQQISITQGSDRNELGVIAGDGWTHEWRGAPNLMKDI